MTATDPADQTAEESPDGAVAVAESTGEVIRLSDRDTAILEAGRQALSGIGSGLPERTEFEHLAAMAVMLSASDIAPKDLRQKPYNSFLLLVTAKDLGIATTAAINGIDIIQGKPVISPEIMRGLVLSSGRGEIRPHPRNRHKVDRAIAIPYKPDGSRYSFEDPNTGEVWHEESEFTWEDAQRMELVLPECRPDKHTEACLKNRNNYKARSCKDNWIRMPKEMLWARACARCAHDFFPDVAMRVYCVPTRGEALTRQGWMPPEKLSVGDEILAFDPVTETTVWTPVRVINTFQGAETLRIAHARWSFVCTADHNWFVQRKGWRQNPNPGLETRPTSELHVGEGSLIHSAPCRDMGDPSITPRDAAILGWAITDGSIYADQRIKVDGTLGALSPTVLICQSKHVDHVRELVGDDARERLAIPAGVRTINGASGGWTGWCNDYYVWRFKASFARPWMERLGIRSRGDAIAAVTRMTTESRWAMLEAMMLANGHDAALGPSGQIHKTFTTGHQEVMDAFQALCQLLGQDTGPMYYNGPNALKVTLRRSQGVQAAALRVTQEAIEDVWCPTTDFGSWVCRLDGVVTITGNSAEELGAAVDAEGRPVELERVELPAGLDNPYNEPEPEPEGPITDDDLFIVEVVSATFGDDERATANKRWAERGWPAPAKLTRSDGAKARAIICGIAPDWSKRVQEFLDWVEAGGGAVDNEDATEQGSGDDGEDSEGDASHTPGGKTPDTVAAGDGAGSQDPGRSEPEPDPVDPVAQALAELEERATDAPDTLVDAVIAEVKEMQLQDVTTDLRNADLPDKGKANELRRLLATHIVLQRLQDPQREKVTQIAVELDEKVAGAKAKRTKAERVKKQAPTPPPEE